MTDHSSLLNPVTLNLPPYPMEALKKIKTDLVDQGKRVLDFGTGDPKIPIWPPICSAIREAIDIYSQYPGIRGTRELCLAQEAYLKRRFGLESGENLQTIPVRGSKEAVFHIALSLVGRAGGRKKILFPDPGYPVYQSSVQFAGGEPVAVRLKEENGYLLEPWTLAKDLQENVAAVWVNYPHNPTGANATEAYWKQLIAWCHEKDVILLSDDCYVDIYDEAMEQTSRPVTPLIYSTDRVLSFMSLSKRSGMTGHRLGFIAGDPKLVDLHAKARANFGLASPEYIQAGGVVAWGDDDHVKERNQIFFRRMHSMGTFLKEEGLIDKVPETTFYLWARVPAGWDGDDVAFCTELAKNAVIASPSSWLSDGLKGFFRLAMVPEDEDLSEAKEVIKNVINQKV